MEVTRNMAALADMAGKRVTWPAKRRPALIWQTRSTSMSKICLFRNFHKSKLIGPYPEIWAHWPKWPGEVSIARETCPIIWETRTALRRKRLVISHSPESTPIGPYPEIWAHGLASPDNVSIGRNTMPVIWKTRSTLMPKGVFVSQFRPNLRL